MKRKIKQARVILTDFESVPRSCKSRFAGRSAPVVTKASLFTAFPKYIYMKYNHTSIHVIPVSLYACAYNVNKAYLILIYLPLHYALF